VVVVPFQRDQLAVAHGADHPAAARTEIARGRELVDLGQLELLGSGLYGGDVEQPFE
jgi:hypothetical protein